MNNNWLYCATELVGVRQSSELASMFIDVITRELSLDTAMLLIPNSDGRRLLPHDPHLDYSWAVTDFDTPFAHVLQSGEAMLLSSEELIFWQSNRAFKQLTDHLGMFDSVLIQPLSGKNSRINHLLFIVGDSNKLVTACQSNDFIKFITAFTHQWTFLSDIESEEKNHKILQESLSDIQHQTYQLTQANDLSNRLIGDSSVMKKLRNQIVSAAESQLSVMIQGDTGTGKELVAQAVHDLSSRKKAPFVAINCAAIPENLLESELFGYSKGAFSGADSDKQGLIAQADKGTLFLDEIGDMPISLQAKLLRVIESRTFRPVGGKQEQSSDFRLISATHVNLLEQVRTKSFRQDLYYRLLQYPLNLPSLKSRLEDIDRLSLHFVELFNQQHGKNIQGLHYKAVERLKCYSFPGNIRELKHLIEFGCVQTADGQQVEEKVFCHRLNALTKHDSGVLEDVMVRTCEVSYQNLSVINDLRLALSQFEKQIICERLDFFGGDRAKVAQSLSVPKRTLAYKCQKLEIR